MKQCKIFSTVRPCKINALIHGNFALNMDITNSSRCTVHPAIVLSTTSDSIIKHVRRGKAVNE